MYRARAFNSRSMYVMVYASCMFLTTIDINLIVHVILKEIQKSARKSTTRLKEDSTEINAQYK